MNEPPIRLLDSPDLSNAERTLLDAARTIAPVRYDAIAGAAKLQAALGSLSGSAGASATVAKTLTALKVSVVLVPMLGAGAYYALRPHRETVSASAKQSAVELVPSFEATALTAPAAARDGSVNAINTRDLPNRDPVERVEPRASRRSPATPIAQPRRPTAPAASTKAHDEIPVPETLAPASAQQQPPAEVGEPGAPEVPIPEAATTPAPASESINELRGIAQARTLLERDPGSALHLLRRLGRDHPKGYFVEERLALTVIALSRAGDDASARTQAIRFLHSYPKSPFADRVRDAAR